MKLQGWGDGHSRVGLDSDVVLGNEALGAPELSLVPVLVILHVQDLQEERHSATGEKPLRRGPAQCLRVTR